MYIYMLHSYIASDIKTTAVMSDDNEQEVHWVALLLIVSH